MLVTDVNVFNMIWILNKFKKFSKCMEFMLPVVITTTVGLKNFDAVKTHFQKKSVICRELKPFKLKTIESFESVLWVIW
jgi:hypothetical protein